MGVVHPYAIAGFLTALAALHATVVVCVAAITARQARVLARRSGPDAPPSRDAAAPDRTLATFGLVSLAAVAVDGGLAIAYARALDETPKPPLEALAIAEAGRVWAMAFLVHFVLQYVRAPRGRLTFAALYGSTVVISIGSAFARPDALSSATLQGASFGATSVPSIVIPATRVGTISAASMVAASVIAVLILLRTVRTLGKESVAAMGVAVLAIAIAYDAARQAGWTVGPPAAPFGYAFLVTTLIVTLVARFTELRGALEHRARDLTNRARDLAKSYADLRAAQDELVRKEQLTAVGELSAVVAHEVRNPLAIISNAVATLRRSGVDAADRETLLGILDEETSRLNRLVGDLLRYTRPINPERQLVSVRELVRRGMALTHGKIGLDVEVVETEATEKIWGDPNLLRQVVDNLIDNAIQAMSSGGVLTITLVNITQDGAPGVEIQVQDTGEGMDTDVRARALDPFFTTRPSGTGLGLAIVARIVDAHGGTLRIKSKAGSGTAMHVFLPRSAEPGPRSRASDAGRRSDPVLPPELARSVSGQR